jgi:CBS domain containing-hemolysin-like protein
MAIEKRQLQQSQQKITEKEHHEQALKTAQQTTDTPIARETLTVGGNVFVLVALFVGVDTTAITSTITLFTVGGQLSVFQFLFVLVLDVIPDQILVPQHCCRH